VSALTFDLEWRTTLMTALLFPTLIALGFWQLERADEKARIAVQQAERVETPARPLASLTGLSDAELAYRKTIVSGYFAPDILMFLDNQIRDGRYGHDVYGVFVDEASGLASLINRGWVIGDASRRSLPQLEIPGGRQTLIASIYVPPGEPYLLAADSFAALDEPLLVQYANTPALRELIYEHSGYRVFPHELRLLPDQPLGFRRDWAVVNVSPEKHQGYAVQWFTMAAALLLFFALRSSNVLSVMRGTGTGASDRKNSNSKES
jgi:surfeit locus 1 family protein